MVYSSKTLTKIDESNEAQINSKKKNPTRRIMSPKVGLRGGLMRGSSIQGEVMFFISIYLHLFFGVYLCVRVPSKQIGEPFVNLADK